MSKLLNNLKTNYNATQMAGSDLAFLFFPVIIICFYINRLAKIFAIPLVWWKYKRLYLQVRVRKWWKCDDR